MGQLDLLEAGPAEDGSEQAEQVRLFLAGEHDIMQKVFAGQEEEERGTQVEIEVRAFCRNKTVNHVEEVWSSNLHKCMEVNGEALQLHAVYKKPYFLLQSTRESVSGTTSHVCYV